MRIKDERKVFDTHAKPIHAITAAPANVAAIPKVLSDGMMNPTDSATTRLRDALDDERNYLKPEKRISGTYMFAAVTSALRECSISTR